MLGFRTWDKYRRSNDEVQTPEFLMSSDVLGGHTAFAFGQSPVITVLFILREFAFRMRMEISAVASQCEHQQEFGVHARRGHVRCSEAGDCGRKGVAER